MLNLTAKSDSKDLLLAGLHLVTIKAVSMVQTKASDKYNDRTEQVEIAFETKTGFIRNWYNIKGFEKDEATGEYKLDEKGNRIENAENTKATIGILERLGLHAGIPDGTKFDVSDLIGYKVGISVSQKDGSDSVEVRYTMTEERYNAKAGITTKAISADVEQ